MYRRYVLNFKNCNLLELEECSIVSNKYVYTDNEELFSKISVPVINIRARYLGSSLKR